MLNYIWAGIMIVSIVFGGITGRMTQVSQAMLNGAQSGIEIFFVLLGMMCLWNGIMEIAVTSGFSKGFSRILWPALSLMFPGLEKGSKAAEAISMNVAANIFGLGNAATPLGLKAMKELDVLNGQKEIASDNMVAFVVLNSVSIQLIPTGVAALRTKYGSPSSMDIIPAVWVASLIALAVAIVLTLTISKLRKIIV